MLVIKMKEYLTIGLFLGLVCIYSNEVNSRDVTHDKTDTIGGLSVATQHATLNSQQEVDYVNTIIGTSSKGMGGTIPCVGPPFAMANFTPQTDQNKMSIMPYVYESQSMIGFMATHQPNPWMGDYGYVSVMPQVGALKVLPESRKMSFSHKDEIAKPYYYKVILTDNSQNAIEGEITATERCSIMRFTFPKSSRSSLVIQGINITKQTDDRVNNAYKRAARLLGYVKIDTVNNEITGYNPDRLSYNLSPELPNFKGYFVIKFSKKMVGWGTWNGNIVNKDSIEQFGKRMGAYISFSTESGESVQVKIATSFISVDQARNNLNHEIPHWDFNRIVNETKYKWQQALERIRVEGVSEEQKTIFYTAMFHTMLYPRIFSEYGKYYSAFDDRIHVGESYTDYSLWDTFRALHPLLILTQPERVNGMITAMLQMYKQGGWLPMWPNPAETNIMIGTHADAVIADAFVKEVRGYDIDLAYEAMRKNAFQPPNNDPYKIGHDREEWKDYEARTGLSYYHSLGYIPSDKTAESVSRTLEYALDDYCIAQVAKLLGKSEDYKRLIASSKNYKNVYNESTGFMAPRMYNGRWDYDPALGFTEGSPWTYLFCVMQDIPGLIDLMGGNEKFAKRLDENFTGKRYVHENEPGHHYPYLYTFCGQPWKTQELIRRITSENYLNQAEGIKGNDDGGQMSAWYIFSVMGFYPVTPASGEYVIGAPQFPKMTLQLNSNGKRSKLEIIARGLSLDNKYVKKISLNGRELRTYKLRHEDIMKGGQLIFEMCNTPFGEEG